VSWRAGDQEKVFWWLWAGPALAFEVGVTNTPVVACWTRAQKLKFGDKGMTMLFDLDAQTAFALFYPVGTIAYIALMGQLMETIRRPIVALTAATSTPTA